MKRQSPIHFDNSFARMPKRFFAMQNPVLVAEPSLIKLNEELANQLGMDVDFLKSQEGISALAGNDLFDGSQPLAQAYAGHQFANFQPQLGDGRALLLGEVVDKNGKRFDIQLKGSGPTPFSRNGDGRAAIGPVLREYIVSEAMFKLGVPTTRALAMVATGEEVLRETKMPGAVLTRIASSHIRVGTFQYFAARQDNEAIELLVDHVIARHYPELINSKNKVEMLLINVQMAQSELIANWMGVGFIHGVMNTDNVSISGETIDYGPCAFMNAYDPTTVYSYIDKRGRYAYGNQPHIALWNLTRFAETLLPLLDEVQEKAVAKAEEILSGFAKQFQTDWLDIFARKIGISKAVEADAELVQSYLELMKDSGADFTLAFRYLGNSIGKTNPALVKMFADQSTLTAWLEKWRLRIEIEEEPSVLMNCVNPAYIPRNHLVEEAIQQAQSSEGFEKLERLHAVLQQPYNENPANSRYMLPPLIGEDVRNTFCGT